MSLRSAVRSLPFASSLVHAARRAAAPLPRQVRFWDGVDRPATEGVAQLFRLWRRGAETAAESTAVFAAYDGGDVVDIGAFHGWYAALLSPKARPGDTFVLVEPDASAIPTLLRIVGALAQTFPDLHYCVVTKAAGDGSCVRPVYPYGTDGHPRFEAVAGDDRDRSVTLDGLVAGLGVRPALLKVDVEGAEVYVLKGALGMLEAGAPRVMLEVHPRWQPEGVEADDLLTLMRERGYVAEDLDVSEDAIRQLWRRAS